MTNDEIMQLEGVALAEAVAREVMGWEKYPAPNADAWAQPWKKGTRIRVIRHDTVGYKNPFRPDIDHNHAAEVDEKLSLSDRFWFTRYGAVWGAFRVKEMRITRMPEVTADTKTALICRVALLAKVALG